MNDRPRAARIFTWARRATLLSSTAATLLIANGNAAFAICAPAAGDNVTATCTGATTDQGPDANVGFGAAGANNLNTTVQAGATVTGTNDGIAFNTGTVNVDNGGSITGGANGVEAGDTATVNNSGSILGNSIGIDAVNSADVTNTATGTIHGAEGITVGGSATVSNFGAISATTFAIFAGNDVTVVNSGNITGADAVTAGVANVTNNAGGTIIGTALGIEADTAKVTNSGTISGDNDGILAGTAIVTNSGSITSALGTGIFAANTAADSATVTNSGTISGSSNGVEATTANVTNKAGGSISGGNDGIKATTANVTNSGNIAGTLDNGIDAVTANITNLGSGTISGATVDGIIASGTATVTNSGSITGGLDGIGAATANVTNNASGIISGVNAGIQSSGGATVTNSGTITGTGVNGVGIDASITGTITNLSSGTISGTFAGIEAGNANVTNAGHISGNTAIQGASATVKNTGDISGTQFGITAVFSANVVNSGTITGGTNGIDVTNIATVMNTGKISGTFDGIHATEAFVTNSGTINGGAEGVAGAADVRNSGTISGGMVGIETAPILTGKVENTGTVSGGSIGIFSNAGNVTNSGIIMGGTAALQFAGNPDTLTLMPGSTIIGAIHLGGGGDTVNFRGGNHNLTFDTLAGATVTGTEPFVVVGNRAVAFDPTPFAIADRALMDFSRVVSSAVPDIDASAAQRMAMADAGGATAFAEPGSNASLIADEFASIPGLAAYAEGSTLPFKNPTAVYGNGISVWARGFAGERTQRADDPLLHTDDRFYGGMIGGAWQARPDLSLGAFAGAGKVRSDLDFNYGGTDSTLVFGGVYARYTWGPSFIKAALQAGHASNDTTRRINNNLVPGGIETASASFGEWYISPEATYGFNYALGFYAGGLYTLTPSLQVRYLHAAFAGFSESGSTADLTVGSRSADDFEERAELKLGRSAALAPGQTLKTSIFAGALGVERTGNQTVNATVLGQAIPFAVPGDKNEWGGLVGGSIEWRTGRVDLFASAEFLGLSNSSSVVSAEGGLRVTF